MDILTILIILLLGVLPTGVLLQIRVFDSLNIYLTDIIVATIFVVTIYKASFFRISFLRFPLFSPLLFFTVWAFISLALNIQYLKTEEFLGSFLYLLRFIFYSNLLFVFHLVKKFSINRFKILFMLSGFMLVILGFIQYIFYPDLKNLFYLGWDDHLNRMFSTFLDPNFAGAIFVMVFILSASAFFETLNKFQFQQILKKFLQETFHLTKISLWSIIVSVFSFVAIFLTYSRSSYFMLFVVLAVFFVFKKKKIGFLIITIFFVLALFLVPKSLGGEGLDLTRTTSIFERVKSYENSLVIFKDSPVYGVGFNSYRFAQMRYGFVEEGNFSTHSGAGVSNSFLFVLATTGIVGLILYITFLYKMIRLLNKARKIVSEKDHFVVAVISLVIGLITHAIFENTLFYTFCMAYFFLLVGCVMRSIETPIEQK